METKKKEGFLKTKIKTKRKIELMLKDKVEAFAPPFTLLACLEQVFSFSKFRKVYLYTSYDKKTNLGRVLSDSGRLSF